MIVDKPESSAKASVLHKLDPIRVIIFGASDDGRELFRQLKSLVLIGLIDVIVFADNDSRMIGREIEGKKIVVPEQLTNYDYDIIVVTPVFFAEISRQLVVLGVSESAIIPYTEDHVRNFGVTDREFENVKIGKYSYYKRGCEKCAFVERALHRRL